MSLQDKIAAAKPTTFLTDGLTQKEVKQAVDEGKRRMSNTVKLIIEMPKAMYESIQKKTYHGNIYPYLEKAIPLDDIKEEIAEEYANTHRMYLEYASGLSHAYEIIDKHVGKADFPQAKDIEPTVENFSEVLDNKLIRDAVSEERCCVCGGVKRFGICQDCGSDM